MIGLHVKHNFLKQNFFEIRFDTTGTVQDVKDKIYSMTGTEPQYEEIYLVRAENDKVCLKPNLIELRDFMPENGMTIEVIDRNPFSMLKDGGLSDVSKVKKFELTDEEYDKKEGSVRAFMRERYENDPEYREMVDNAKQKRLDAIEKEKEEAGKITVGERCEYEGLKRGVVKYKGENEKLGKGIFIGIEFDEPVGDCDGSVEGQELFEGRPKFCQFVKPGKVKTGDFPEREIDLEDSESEL